MLKKVSHLINLHFVVGHLAVMGSFVVVVLFFFEKRKKIVVEEDG